MISFEEAKARLHTAGQSHVLQFWAELSADERSALLDEISQLEPKELLEHCRGAVAAASRHSSTDAGLDARMEPVAPEFIGSVRESDKETLQLWDDEGTEARPCLNFEDQNNTLCILYRHLCDILVSRKLSTVSDVYRDIFSCPLGKK